MANVLNFTSLSRRGAYDAQVETVTVGALSRSKRISKLSVDATKAFTLAAGLWVGQEKIVICSVAANSPVGALTLTVLGGNTISAFGVVGECARLVWDGALWLPMALSGVTVSTV
jgi:hypothetical protein